MAGFPQIGLDLAVVFLFVVFDLNCGQRILEQKVGCGGHVLVIVLDMTTE